MDEIRYRRDIWKLLLLSTLPGTNTITNQVAGDGAEIGVAEGLFSCDMLNWPVKFRTFYMVDRWRQDIHTKGDSSMPQEWHSRNYDRAAAVADSHKGAKLLRGDSVEMAKLVPDRSLALVYIDGDHSFIGVTNDIHAWFPKLIDGGVMAFHDYENEAYGVRRAVQLFAEQQGLKVHHIPEDKSEDAGAWFRKP